MSTTVILRAIYSCTLFTSDEEYPMEWGGFCDPYNPWGTADEEPRDNYHVEGDEAVEVELPIDEAVRFVEDFPGGVWELNQECQPEQSPRTGVYTQVTLHVSGPGADDALDLVGPFCEHTSCHDRATTEVRRVPLCGRHAEEHRSFTQMRSKS